MGRLLEASGLPELAKQVPPISPNTDLGYQSDLCPDENRLLRSLRVNLVCRSILSVVVPRNFVR